MNQDKQSVALYIPSLAGGGAERITLNLASGLAKRGVAVDLVVSSFTGELVQQVPAGARVIDLGGHRTLRSIPSLIRYLRNERPTSLLSAMNHANVAAVWSAKLAGYSGRVVLAEHIHLPDSRYSNWQRAFNLAIRVSYPLAARVVAVSNGVKQSLIDNAQVAQRLIEVIYNPVLSDDFSRSSRQSRPPLMSVDGTPVMIGMGRLEPQKNFRLLLKAFALLRKSRKAQLIILGEGSERAALEGLVSELGLQEDVHLPGFVNDPFNYLAHADAFVLSSDWEGLPTVLIEALALGTPVVSTDCTSGPQEILNSGEFGRLVPVGDVTTLAAEMAATLDEPFAPAPTSWLEQFSEGVATTKYMEALGLKSDNASNAKVAK